MRRFAFLLPLLFFFFACDPESGMYEAELPELLTAEARDAMSPDDALQALREGNRRFVEGNLHPRSYTDEIEFTAGGQNPHTLIMSCIDSRVPAETVFDTRIGEVFSSRLAGNVVNEDAIGGMEFAAELAGVKLIVVMGHTKCGAVAGAAADAELGHLTGLLEKIGPAVERASAFDGEQDSSNYEWVDAIARENVSYTIEQIRDKSEILRSREEAGELKITGAMYDIRTGKVSFFE